VIGPLTEAGVDAGVDLGEYQEEEGFEEESFMEGEERIRRNTTPNNVITTSNVAKYSIGQR
jgi:hypothetical protein